MFSLKGVSTAKRNSLERGAAAVEFALVAMLLVTLLIGIMEFGFAFFIQGTLSGSAREAARYYAIHHAEASAETEAKESAVGAGAGFVDAAMVSVGVCASDGSGDKSVTVTIKYPFAGGITGFFGTLLPTGFELTGKGVMRCNG